MGQSVDPAPIEMVYELVPRPERWELKDEDNVPDTLLQDEDTRVLVLVLQHWITCNRLDATAGSNLALRWDRKRPTVGVDPDVYLVEPALAPDTTSLRLWEPGRKPPRLAIEVVSEGTAEIDYLDKPERYAANGTRELWIFDPLRFGPALTAHGGPYRLQVWRRVAKGKFKRIHADDGPAYSRELGAWIVLTNDGRQLRIADDRAGSRLWPTAEEAEREAREAAERAREAAEKAREAAEQAHANERKAREKAERKARKAATDATFKTLCGLYARRLERPLSDHEQAALRQRITELGADRVGETLFEHDRETLAAWIAADAPPKP